MYFQRGGELTTPGFESRAARRVRNLDDKCALLEAGRAHGIIVYDAGDPVGWCQFGPSHELPLVDDEGQPCDHSEQAGAARWRITCFVTAKSHRRRGIATMALRGALQSIREQGGGVVEAYPVVAWMRPDPVAVRRSRRGASGGRLVVDVDGIGGVTAAVGTFAHVSTQGTMSIFEREGFQAVAAVRGNGTAAMLKSPDVDPSEERVTHIRMEVVI